MSQPISVEQHLSFPSDQQAMQAGAELIFSGWPGVRTGGGGTPTHLPTVIALYEVVPTVESLRAARQQLIAFAAPRGGAVVADQEGGESVFSASSWPPPGSEPMSEAEMEQEDQMVIDNLFAFDIDLKRPVTITAGIAFTSEQQARQIASELFLARWPEVHVVPAQSFWVVEVVTYTVPVLKAVRDLRVSLTTYAGPAGGSFLGLTTRADAPKQVQEES